MRDGLSAGKKLYSKRIWKKNRRFFIISKKGNRNKLVSAVVLLFIFSFSVFSAFKTYSQNTPQDIPGNIRVLLDTLAPLSNDRQDRALLYQYSVGDLSTLPKEDAKWVIRDWQNVELE